MKICVLDSSALLRYVDNGPGSDRVQKLLQEASLGQLQILISALNWGEIFYAVARRYGDGDAVRFCQRLRALPIAIIQVDDLAAERAGSFRNRHSLAYADSFAASLAQHEDATLVTADFDFKRVASVISVEFLPGKKP